VDIVVPLVEVDSMVAVAAAQPSLLIVVVVDSLMIATVDGIPLASVECNNIDKGKRAA